MSSRRQYFAAKEASRLPVFATVIFDDRKKLLTGGSVESVVALLEGLGVDALGLNCGLGPVQMKEIVADLLKFTSLPVIVNPNAGLPRSEGGRTVYDINAPQFAEAMEEIVRLGANLVGGCCGTTPDHIRRTVAICKELPQRLPTQKSGRWYPPIPSVVIGEDPVIVGERINPTGKSKFKQALRDHNIEYILREGRLPSRTGGAHVLMSTWVCRSH